MGTAEFDNRSMNDSASLTPSETPPGSSVSGLIKIRVNKAGNAAQPQYKSYMLRVWREGQDGGWRATLESVTTGEVRAFAHLDQLVAFLEENGGETKERANAET